MVGHDVGRLARDHCRVNLGIEWLAPGKGGFCNVDFVLTLIKFIHDLCHPHAVAATEKIPIDEWGRCGLRESREKPRKRIDSRFHVDSCFHGGYLFVYKKN